MQPLGGIRVVELATGVAGSYSGKLLADFGADVVKVEPPGGDPTRHVGPFVSDEPHAEQSALFLHLNTNKRSIVADITSADGRALVEDLVRGADIVIESYPPGVLDAAGLGYEHLRSLRPGLVVTSVTAFGQDGPYASYRTDEIVTYAMAGPMSSTGVASREPLKLAGDQITYQTGNMAALATLAALTIAEQSGESIHIDLSQFECQAASIDRRVTFLLYKEFCGMDVPRSPGPTQAASPAGYYPTEDGYVLVFTIPTWLPRMLATLHDDDLAARFALPGWMSDPDLPNDVEGVLYPWLLERTRNQAALDAQANRWPVTPLNPPVDVLADVHFAERGFFVDVEHPVAGSLRQLGAPFRLGDSWALHRPAPCLDQHRAEILAELATPRPSRAVVRNEPRLPLTGVRVLDLTVVWAGPAVTMHLSDLGAEVIRVDNPYVFPNATRGMMPRPPKELVPALGALGGGYPGLDPGERPWNRHGMYSAHARNKLSCTLDLRRPLGRETFLRLVERADVFVENNSVKVLDDLGIGWGVLSARNPRLILCRMPPLGLSGPYRDWLGFGANFEALCGLTALRGYADSDPTSLTPTFHMDPASGATGAFAVMCALRRRARTGKGELLEFAQSENMMQHIGEWFIEAARTGVRHETLGNRHHRRAPQGCYPTVGDDAWVVLSVGDDDEWAGLQRAMGAPAWAADERFSTLAGRRQHHDEIDRHLTAWTSERTATEVFELCQAHGVPAGPVNHETELLADPHLRAKGFFRKNGSSDLGTFEFPRHPWRWDGPDLRWEPLCRMGADNEYVLREVLGLDDHEWSALEAEGHLSLDYLAEDGTRL